MKKMVKIFTAVSTFVMAGACLTACGGSTRPRDSGTLSIMVYNGGYGYEWLDEIIQEYEKESGNMVEYVADKNTSTKAEASLTSKAGSEYDIFISHDLNWQNFADRGLIATLDDLYDSEVDGKKFSDRVLKEAKEVSSYQGYKDKAAHYYKVCLTQGAGGFVYNSTMFEENNWTVPTTYDELVTLCDQMRAKNITPFAWAGGGETRDYYWDYPLYNWWAELDGIDNINAWKELKGADGKYSSGYDNFDPDGKFKNFKKAYEMWYNLVGTNPANSNTDAQGAQLVTAQSLFFEGKAAMIPYGQWAKHEIESAMKKEFSFDVKMMKTPRAKAASDYYNFMVGFGDSMIVAKNSANTEIAKDFLKFMSKEYSLKKFVEKADGPFLAFDYSGVDMSELTSQNTYVQSMYEILTTCKNFSLATNSPIAVANGTIDIQPWIGNTRYYKAAYSDPASNTPDQVFKKVYDSAKSSWNKYCRNAEVD